MATYNNEGDVKRDIKKVLKRYAPDLHYWMPGASQFGVSGTHDFVMVQGGLLWTVEAKFGYNPPSANQVTFAEKTQRAGGVCLCVRETNIWEVQMVADYIRDNGVLPIHMNHDFAALEKGKRKK